MPVPAARDPLPACRQRAPRRLSRGQEVAQVGWFRSSRRKGLPRRREDVRVAGVTVLPDMMAELGLVQSAALAAGQWGAAEGGVLHLQRRCGGGAGRRGPSGGGPEKRAPCHGAAAARETGGGTGQFPHLRRQVGSRVSAGTRVREEGGPGHQTWSLGGNRKGAWPSFPGKGRGENDRDCDRGTGVSPGCCRREHGRWLRSVVEPSALRRRAADGLPPESPPHPRRPLTAPG